MKPLRTAQLEKAKLLVRVPNWIGDAVMCLPALRELRRALPGAEITLAGRPWVLDVFPTEELRCRTFAYDTRHGERGILGRWRFAARMKQERFDAAILFQNAFDAALVAALASIPVRAGYARECRGILLTHAVEVPKDGKIPPHETYYYLELLRRLGLIARLPEVAEIRLTAAGVDRSRARSQLLEFLRQQSSLRNATALDDTNQKFFVGIGAGASFGTAKRWPGERFTSLAARLHRELGATPIFFGSPEEAPLVESLLPGAGAAAVSLAGKTSLPDFIRIIPGCDLYVTNDTGTMHVAAALGVPTIALFGPTDENGTRPLGAHSQVLAGVAYCRPCKLRECPIDHRCMTSLSVDAVFEAARTRLAEKVVRHNEGATVSVRNGSTGLRARRILIVRLGSMGDVIHGLPVASALKEQFPECEIDWLVETRWRDLLVGNPALHYVIDVDTLEWRKRPFSPAVWSALADRLAALRERHYDYALDLQGAIKSAVACAISGARQTIGFDTPWIKEPPCAALYTRRVRVTAQHVVDANLALAAALGARCNDVRFPLPPGDPSLLAPNLPRSNFAVLNPGAGWRSKCWPLESYAALADALDAEFQIPVVLNLGPGEEPLAANIEGGCQRANPQRFSGTITALIALLRRSRLMVGPDTGPLHLAAALGVPTVGLFGPTDPRRNGPYGRRQRSLRPSGAATTYRHSSEDGAEMRRIPPEQVLEAIRELFHE